MDDVKVGLRYAFQTSYRLTLALPATGHAAIEAVMVNLLEKGDVVLIAKNGIWGDRAADMATRNGERAQHCRCAGNADDLTPSSTTILQVRTCACSTRLRACRSHWLRSRTV